MIHDILKGSIQLTQSFHIIGGIRSVDARTLWVNVNKLRYILAAQTLGMPAKPRFGRP